jgi:hypothetical protein
MTRRTAVKRDDPKKKNTGKGGLDTWFSGHGGGKPNERATWGDWVAITPVKHTVKKDEGKNKTYEPGDIVGPCGVSSEAEWSSVTNKGSQPLKCMPREKAHKMPKKERAQLAKNKRREEQKNKNKGKTPVKTPTFSEEAKDIKKSASRIALRYLKRADFYRQVTPPDELSSLSQGTPTGKSDNPKGTSSSSLPNGDSARNIGRPSPDSPNLKYRDLDRKRKPTNKEDMGYVHDSGSGSARVIPYDSGFANNSSALRKASLHEDDMMAIDLSFFGRYDLPHKGKPSTNGMKLSILGKTVEDIYKVYGLLKPYLHKNRITYKVATRKRVEQATPPQNYKIMTIYIPDGESWSEIAEDVSQLLHKGRYKGWHNIPTPPLYQHYANAVFYRNDRDSSGAYIPAYRVARSQPAQDLAGVKTWVDKSRQDQVKTDTQPKKTKPDYADGSPDRDRVLPLPDGHPKGRDEVREGPGVMNAPPGSSGQGGASRPKKDPSSLNDQPNGKALHERPRSSGVPGDEYGHPYIDQSTSTGLKRRGAFHKEFVLHLDEMWDVGEDGELVKLAIRSVLPPRQKQRSQKGQVKRRYERGYARKPPSEKRKEAIKAKRRYRQNPSRHIRYQQRRQKSPSLFKRLESGGIHTKSQKNERDKKTKENKK